MDEALLIVLAGCVASMSVAVLAYMMTKDV